MISLVPSSSVMMIPFITARTFDFTYICKVGITNFYTYEKIVIIAPIELNKLEKILSLIIFYNKINDIM